MDVHLTGELGERLVDSLTHLAAAYSEQQDHIKVWRYADAPKELRALTFRGGDEDWIVVIPPQMDTEHYIPFLDHISPNVYEHRLADGTLVVLGAHA